MILEKFDVLDQLLSLALDGLTGGQQDRLRESNRTDPHLMMFALNLGAVLFLLLRTN